MFRNGRGGPTSTMGTPPSQNSEPFTSVPCFHQLEPVFLLFGADPKINVSIVSASDGEAAAHPSQFTSEGSAFLNHESSIGFSPKQTYLITFLFEGEVWG